MQLFDIGKMRDGHKNSSGLRWSEHKTQLRIPLRSEWVRYCLEPVFNLKSICREPERATLRNQAKAPYAEFCGSSSETCTNDLP